MTKKRILGVVVAAAALALVSGASWANGRVSVLADLHPEAGPNDYFAPDPPLPGPNQLPILEEEMPSPAPQAGLVQGKTGSSQSGGGLGGASLSPFGGGGSIGESRDATQRSLQKTIRRLG